MWSGIGPADLISRWPIAWISSMARRGTPLPRAAANFSSAKFSASQRRPDGTIWGRETRLIHRHDHVVFFAFAEQQMFAEQQIGTGHEAGRTGFADVVDVYAAAFGVFARLPLGWT
jgi:hypothetical protein